MTCGNCGFALLTSRSKERGQCADCARLSLPVRGPRDPDAQPLGDCDWCSRPVYSDQPYEEGNGGAGVMHADCFLDKFEEEDYNSREVERELPEEEP